MEMKYTLMTNKTLNNSTTKLDLSYREEATQFYSYIFYILYLKNNKTDYNTKYIWHRRYFNFTHTY